MPESICPILGFYICVNATITIIETTVCFHDEQLFKSFAFPKKPSMLLCVTYLVPFEIFPRIADSKMLLKCPAAPNPPIISRPKAALQLSSAIVFESTTNWPAVSKDTNVPLIILPGIKVVPANTTAIGTAVVVLPAMVVIMDSKLQRVTRPQILPIPACPSLPFRS